MTISNMSCQHDFEYVETIPYPAKNQKNFPNATWTDEIYVCSKCGYPERFERTDIYPIRPPFVEDKDNGRT